MGLLGASDTAAFLVFGLAAGVVADRSRRRSILLFTTLASRPRAPRERSRSRWRARSSYRSASMTSCHTCVGTRPKRCAAKPAPRTAAVDSGAGASRRAPAIRLKSREYVHGRRDVTRVLGHVRPDGGAVDIDCHRAAELGEVTDRVALEHAVFRDVDDALGDDEEPKQFVHGRDLRALPDRSGAPRRRARAGRSLRCGGNTRREAASLGRSGPDERQPPQCRRGNGAAAPRVHGRTFSRNGAARRASRADRARDLPVARGAPRGLAA